MATKRAIAEQQHQLGQGALFLIDNAGLCPPNARMRDFTDLAIASHLAMHHYHYQLKGYAGLKNRQLVDSHNMRRYLRDLYTRSVKPDAKFERQPTGYDAADSLFLVGGGGLEPNILTKFD